jgi:hypothetical protein
MKRLTTEKFIIQAKAVHGDKYDYSLVEYTLKQNKIKIICPEHGVFEQRAGQHKNGSDCPRCALGKRGKKRTKTTEQFIEEAKAVHGDKYDYSLVEYTGCFNKVKIICSKHGEFEQAPNDHKKGSNCPLCARRSITQQEFIAKAQSVHGDRYGYSLVEYRGVKTKVKIICPEHGPFEQAPRLHLEGDVCKLCSDQARRKTTEQFIKEAKAVHGDKYDYSLVVLAGMTKKVKIICPEHGPFEQQPSNHRRGNGGCPQCCASIHSQRMSDTFEQFVEKATAVHGDTYEYISYTPGGVRSVRLRCSEHGEFDQLAGNHLAGNGCKKCANALLSENKMYSREQFIETARAHHGDKYDYSLVEYTGGKNKVKIICHHHGVFEQAPSNHTGPLGSDCPACAKENARKKITKTTEQFIEEAKAVHGDKYDYSKAVYTKSADKIKIICPEHGEFEVEAMSHLKGTHCKRCAARWNKSEDEVREILEELFPGYSFPNIRPRWLINPKTGYPLELDCYNEELQLALEYQGFHHYSVVEVWGGETRLKEIQERDQIKRNACKQKGITLLEADSRIFNRKSKEEKKVLIEGLLKEHSVITEKL